ncbi:GNAT family N-acetyltransferase [Desulfoluna spongiiphila]|uniref:GNAT family N-acetyltransferase n=1 Tax=Desulfoluna spongiiphila TaxID=419481 RepID=UPI001259B8DB|nr:GNAT family N-acetyltransferase [Desulfoluna spongiiphila]VVS94627.1 acyl-coa n-acyltransferase [Desulfoluna spongiiphila]
MEVKIADPSDIESTLRLHYRYQIDSINEADKKDGFVTTPFTEAQLDALIARENGLFVAKENGEVVGYAMAASWKFWSVWPMFARMIEGLPELSYNGRALSVDNSFQYGPICIDKCLRGHGVLENIFQLVKSTMGKRYPVLITFVNKNNPRSHAAHTRKLGLDVINEFEFNANHYYEMACEIHA